MMQELGFVVALLDVTHHVRLSTRYGGCFILCTGARTVWKLTRYGVSHARFIDSAIRAKDYPDSKENADSHSVKIICLQSN